MKIRVNSFNELKKVVADLPDGGALELAADATVSTALDRFALPEDIRADLVVFVNGRPAGLQTRLREGDHLVFFPPMAGG